MEGLQDVNDSYTRVITGTLILVATCMVIGFIGNVHVLLVFAFRMKSTNHRIFILFLSSLDLTACAITMPLTIYALKEPLASAGTCKLYIFINFSISIAATFTLLVIAIDRYRKICKPFGRQMSQRHAKFSCVLVICSALLCSLPVAVLMDSVRLPLINADTCVLVNKTGTIYYRIFLTVVILSILVALIVLYAFIWKVTKDYRTHTENHSPDAVDDKSCSVNATSAVDLNSTPVSFSGGRSDNIGQPNEPSNTPMLHFIKPRTTTVVFSLITVIFFISYIPSVVIQFVLPDTVHNLRETETMILSNARCLVYISNMANCFIYGCVDAKFRHEVKALYMRILFCK